MCHTDTFLPRVLAVLFLPLHPQQPREPVVHVRLDFGAMLTLVLKTSMDDGLASPSTFTFALHARLAAAPATPAGRSRRQLRVYSVCSLSRGPLCRQARGPLRQQVQLLGFTSHNLHILLLTVPVLGSVARPVARGQAPDAPF